MRQISTFLVVVFGILNLVAQGNVEPFKPHGKPVVKIFADWHQGMGNEEFSDDSGFEIKRAVFGYQYQFSPKISAKLVLDTDNPGGKLTEVAYLRNAYVAYKADLGEVYFGIIGIKHFKTQENNWGYRYLYKSAMDEYKFNNSVDAGVYAKANATDWISFDLTISNGEGAKSEQDTEGKYRFGLGTEIEALKNLTFRAYYDYFDAPTPTGTEIINDQTSIALFLGYEVNAFRVGLEYNTLQSFGFEDNDDRQLYSVYGSYVFNNKLQAFARYDKLEADQAGLSEYVAIGGLEYAVVKGVKIAPNYRHVNQGDGDLEHGHYAYLNLEYKF